MFFSKEIIKKIISDLLKIKFDSKIYNTLPELRKAKKSFEIQVDNLTNYIFENYLKTDELTIDFIKWLHKSFYPEWTIIKTIRDGKIYNNLVWEWRLNEARHKEDHHLHWLQKDIEKDLIEYTNYFNSIKYKKRIDILKYYFDFLRVHPFADSNLTIISIICELEFFKYWLKSLNFLQTRFKDGKFLNFCIFYYEENKYKFWILEEIEKMIDDFFNWKLSKEIIEKKEKVNIKTTQELFWWNKKNNFSSSPHYVWLKKLIDDNFINISTDLPDYKLRKIVYNNTIHYLENAFFRNNVNVYQTIINWYCSDTERIIYFLKNNILNQDKLSIEDIKWFHKNLYPNWFIQKFRDTNWREIIQMIPGEYRSIELHSKTNQNKNLYLKPFEVEEWMIKIVTNLNNSKFKIKDILLFMADFSRVHPFWDGNWRTIDILVDVLLLKNWFEPFYFWELKQKSEILFYKALDKVYETRDVKYLYEFIESIKK